LTFDQPGTRGLLAAYMERVLAFAAYYWVLDEHSPSACRDGNRARGAL
jgi:hypothetical protein